MYHRFCISLHIYPTPQHVDLGPGARRPLKRLPAGLRCQSMQDRANESRRITLPRTLVNEECKGRRCIPLDDQGEAVAEAEVVAVVAGTICSGGRTVFSIVFSRPGTVFSTVTVRARGAGGAASSRLLPICPRRNPKSSPTASTTSTSRTNLASPTFPLPGLTLLLPFLLALHSSCRTHTCRAVPTLVVRLLRAPKQGSFPSSYPAHIVHASLLRSYGLGL